MIKQCSDFLTISGPETTGVHFQCNGYLCIIRQRSHDSLFIYSANIIHPHDLFVDFPLVFFKISIMNIKAIAGRIGMDYDNVIEDFCGDTGEIRKKLESFTEDCDFSALKVAVE